MRAYLFRFLILTTVIITAVACGNSNKKRQSSFFDIERERKAHEDSLKLLVTDSMCISYRNAVLKKYFGSDYELKTEHISKAVMTQCYVCDEGMVEGSFNGVKSSFEYQMEIEVDEQNVKKWKTWRLFITDTSTGNRITVVDIGNEKDPNSYNKKADDSHGATAFDLSTNEIEDMIQRQWNIENASSPVGAESSNVFNVHLESVSSNKVVVSYDLRSTYHGQKKFTHLNATLTPNANGQWAISNLAY